MSSAGRLQPDHPGTGFHPADVANWDHDGAIASSEGYRNALWFEVGGIPQGEPDPGFGPLQVVSAPAPARSIARTYGSRALLLAAAGAAGLASGVLVSGDRGLPDWHPLVDRAWVMAASLVPGAAERDSLAGATLTSTAEAAAVAVAPRATPAAYAPARRFAALAAVPVVEPASVSLSASVNAPPSEAPVAAVRRPSAGVFETELVQGVVLAAALSDVPARLDAAPPAVAPPAPTAAPAPAIVEPLAPAAESLEQPMLEPVAPPAVEPVALSTPPAIVGPLAPAAAPLEQPMLEPVAPPTVEPVALSTPPAIVEPLAPAAEPLEQPMLEPVAPPAVERAALSTPPAIIGPLAPAAEPLEQPMLEPVAPPAVEPVALSAPPVVELPAAPAPHSAEPAAPSYRVQLATLRYRRNALPVWEKFVRRFAPLSERLERYVTTAETVHGQRYLLQVGPFADAPQATAMCERILRKGDDCVVVPPSS